MKFLLIALLLAAALTAGYFSVSNTENRPPETTVHEQEKTLRKVKPPQAKKDFTKTEIKQEEPEKKIVIQTSPKPVKKKAETQINVLDTDLKNALANIDEKLLKRRAHSLRELLKRLANLSDADKELLTKLILLHDQNALGINKDIDFANHIEDQIEDLLGNDYELFNNRSTYKMLGDLHDMFKKTPLSQSQETEIIDYFNKNMDAVLINKIIAAEYNQEGFKGAENPLLDFDAIKGQLDTWKNAPVNEEQSATMNKVHTMLTEGLRMKAAELNIQEVLGK